MELHRIREEQKIERKAADDRFKVMETRLASLETRPRDAGGEHQEERELQVIVSAWIEEQAEKLIIETVNKVFEIINNMI